MHGMDWSGNGEPSFRENNPGKWRVTGGGTTTMNGVVRQLDGGNALQAEDPLSEHKQLAAAARYKSGVAPNSYQAGEWYITEGDAALECSTINQKRKPKRTLSHDNGPTKRQPKNSAMESETTVDNERPNPALETQLLSSLDEDLDRLEATLAIRVTNSK